MSLRIAFDVDGVFADMEGALRRLAAASRGEPCSAERLGHSATAPLPLTGVERRRVWRCARRTHNFWDTLDEIEPGALARLRAVSEHRRWHIAFFTQRPSSAGDSTQLQTQRWLARHGFGHASVLVVPGSRGQLARALNLDAVIDDVPAYCLDVQLESEATPALVWRGDDAGLPPGTRRLGIEVFRSVGACVDHLEARDARASARCARRPRFAERLRHRLGFRSDRST